MKTLRTAAIVSITAIALGGGCANLADSVRLTDRLPEGEKKGYAEFYLSADSTIAIQIPVYQIQEKRERFMGSACFYALDPKVDSRFRRRIACAPGPATFVVRTGNDSTSRSFFPKPLSQRVDLVIHEGMITPVRITLITPKNAPLIGDIRFRSEVIAEAPVSPLQHEERMQQNDMARRRK